LGGFVFLPVPKLISNTPPDFPPGYSAFHFWNDEEEMLDFKTMMKGEKPDWYFL
jgi:hypothetical protein